MASTKKKTAVSKKKKTTIKKKSKKVKAAAKPKPSQTTPALSDNSIPFTSEAIPQLVLDKLNAVVSDFAIQVVQKKITLADTDLKDLVEPLDNVTIGGTEENFDLTNDEYWCCVVNSWATKWQTFCKVLSLWLRDNSTMPKEDGVDVESITAVKNLQRVLAKKRKAALRRAKKKAPAAAVEAEADSEAASTGETEEEIPVPEKKTKKTTKKNKKRKLDGGEAETNGSNGTEEKKTKNKKQKSVSAEKVEVAEPEAPKKTKKKKTKKSKNKKVKLDD